MTNMVSNLHAGKDFYLDSLKSNYHLSFSDDFASVMEEIEREYKVEEQAYRYGEYTSGKKLAGYPCCLYLRKEQSRSNVIYIGCILQG